MQLNLERTIVKAPTQGGVSNFSLSEGFYASAGQAIMTFVSTEDIWIEAYFRENSLSGNVTVGDGSGSRYRFAPGQIVKGRVSSIDWGCGLGGKMIKRVNLLKPGVSKQAGYTSNSDASLSWLNLNAMIAKECWGLVGKRTWLYIAVITLFFNAIGKLWIRFISVLSYVR